MRGQYTDNYMFYLDEIEKKRDIKIQLIKLSKCFNMYNKIIFANCYSLKIILLNYYILRSPHKRKTKFLGQIGSEICVVKN